MNLIDGCSNRVKEKIKLHHERNGGMSRYHKLPIYLNYLGIEATNELIEKYSKKFSEMVVQNIISSPWVPGVLDYLNRKKEKQLFIITSATPTQELIYILKQLKIGSLFDEVFGSPMSKKTAIKKSLIKHKIDPMHCLMFGDAEQDFNAANKNKVPFIYRQHDSNEEFKKRYKGTSIKDFYEKI